MTNELKEGVAENGMFVLKGETDNEDMEIIIEEVKDENRSGRGAL